MDDQDWIYTRWAKVKRRSSPKIHDRIATEAQKIKPRIQYGKFKSFTSYSIATLKESLITGWPQIASSKNWILRIIKTSVFLLCVMGFGYQTFDFLTLYMSYPTSVNVHVSNPSEVLPPALTVCNRNRRQRTVVCGNDPFSCSIVPSMCKTYPRFCPELNDSKAFKYMVFPFYLLGVEDFDWATTYEEAHQKNFKSCTILLDKKRMPCKGETLQIPVVDLIGEPNYCQVVQSLHEKPDEKLEYYPNTFTYEIELETKPEEYLKYTEPVKMQVAVHDRRTLINPFVDGKVLDGGKEYICHVTMTESKLLPSPYSTHCRDYLAEWRKNNGSGPLNQRSCIELCKLETLLKMDQCIDKNVFYPHEEQLCAKVVETTTTEIIRKCSISCDNACEDRTYQAEYEELRDLSEYCIQEDEHCKKKAIKISVSFKRFLLTSYTYEPKFESVELYSYVGGYMGMWLGLSLISLFDLFETICHLLFYPIGRLLIKHKKKKIKPSHDIYGRKLLDNYRK